MILESIVTTVDENGRVNVAPMGPEVDDDWGRFVLRPFPGSTTFRNLLASGRAVIHVTDDASLFARAAVGRVETDGLVEPIDGGRWYRLRHCHRWFAVDVERELGRGGDNGKDDHVDGRGVQTGSHGVQADSHAGGGRAEVSAEAHRDAAGGRIRLRCRVRHAGTAGPFFGFNRAKHAVIEAAILATRTHLLSAVSIERELSRLCPLVEKTAGRPEREAFEMLCRVIRDRLASFAGDRADPRSEGGPRPDVVRVRTGGRLHFGLLDAAEPFGGAGVMVAHPETEVVVTRADRFAAAPEIVERVEPIARRVAERYQLGRLPDCEVALRHGPPRHSGFGSGTQFALAVAEGISALLGQTADRRTLARVFARRGKRSAVGIHGYFQGGLLFEDPLSGPGDFGRDAGDVRDGEEGLRRRIELPESWRVALLLPASGGGAIAGREEERRFARLGPGPRGSRARLRRLLTDELLPAAEVADFRHFGESLTRYNRLSGELFAGVQGGPYRDERVTALIDLLIRHGGQGVGQSSWGPGVFCWFPDVDSGQAFLGRLPALAGEFSALASQIVITGVRNAPRDVIHQAGVIAPPARGGMEVSEDG